MFHLAKTRVLLGLLAIPLSAGLGLLWGQQFNALNIWCSGQRIQQMPEQEGAARWLFSRYNLQLNAGGQGSFRLLAQLRGAKGESLGQMNRHASLTYQRKHELLRLTVGRSGKSENDNMDTRQLPLVILAMLQEDAVLSYRIQRLNADLYLLDNGVGTQRICRNIKTTQPQAWLRHWLSWLLPAASASADE